MNLDRATLSSTQLYQLATRGKTELSQAEKDRVSTDYLFVLAVTNKLCLNQHDKDRLCPLHVGHLAIVEKIDLSHADKARLPTDLLFEVFVAGYTDLRVEEMVRFTAEQLAYVNQLEAANAASQDLAGARHAHA